MTEDTVGSVSTEVNQKKADVKPKKPIPSRLRGVPAGLLCRARDVQAELGWSPETWQMYRLAGLKTFNQGTNAEVVLTDELHKFIASNPTLPPRPSIERKQKQKARK